MIEEWLKSKGTTLWADWDISADDRRALAAKWFGKEISDYFAFVGQQAKLHRTEQFTQEYPSKEWDVV